MILGAFLDFPELLDGPSADQASGLCWTETRPLRLPHCVMLDKKVSKIQK